jgi:hypothetical protein
MLAFEYSEQQRLITYLGSGMVGNRECRGLYGNLCIAHFSRYCGCG